MKDFYIWYCVAAILIGTGVNYWVVSPSRGWSSGGGSYSTSTGGWHK